MENKLKNVLMQALSYSLKDDAEAVAERLIDRYGGLHRIFSMDVSAIRECEKIDERTARLIKLIGAITARRGMERLKFGQPATDEQYSEYVKYLFVGVPIERIYIIFISEKGCPIATELVGEGIVNYSEISLRKIVELAIKYKAASVIMVHNHPRGVSDPSTEDVSVTSNLDYLLNLSGVKLLKHIVVADDKLHFIMPDE